MKKNGRIRIIGGQWKRRRLRCAAVAGLRPSPDAVRETVFNWLPHRLDGKVCLDLFAGSGAFGFEAASRGAPKVLLVESHPRAVELLRANRDALRAEEQVDIFAGRAEEFLRQHGRGDRGDRAQNPRGFDVVFLDPPFSDAAQTIAPVCENLQRHNLLNAGALVYIESPRVAAATDAAALTLPPSWRIIRQNHCGAVCSTLIQT